nr:SH3 domain-containing protein [Sphingomonas sp.]
MKGSNATSARATTAPRHTGQSSGRHQPTRTSADEFALAGPTNSPDPDFNAYRKDLADVALAGTVIASHYAEPLERHVAHAAQLRSAAADDAEVIGDLAEGDLFELLDDSLGWAWGYAGEDRRVGYVASEALA